MRNISWAQVTFLGPNCERRFTGTLRDNLDPFGDRDDGALWEALRTVRLEEWVQREGDKLAARTGPRLGPLGSPAWGCHPEGTGAGGLQTAVSEAGGNMSVGQRQLICLAGVAMAGAFI